MNDSFLATPSNEKGIGKIKGENTSLLVKKISYAELEKIIAHEKFLTTRNFEREVFFDLRDDEKKRVIKACIESHFMGLQDKLIKLFSKNT